jgi:homoserine dehydrogenase
MKIGIGVLGLGTVGSGVLEIIRKQAAIWKESYGFDFDVVLACARSRETRKHFDELGYTTTASADEVLEHPDVKIVLELVGGYDLPLEWTKKAFSLGKHVVTANKALIAKHGAELFPLSASANVYFEFEAAVAAGIPIIKSIQESFVGNRISSLSGIINGTCNYILTEMSQKGSAYQDVLEVAQQKGYAEADPTFDVEGIDAAHKLAILASLCSRQFVDFEKMHIEGISQITQADLKFLDSNNCVIKLLGCFQQLDGCLRARVHPAILPKDHLLASVDGVLNAAYLEMDAFGATLQTGAGAGKLPTASGVIGDLVSVGRSIFTGVSNPISMRFYNRENPAIIESISELETKYYMRFAVKDEAGVLSKITGLLSDSDISVDCIQQPHSEVIGQATIAVLTHIAKESQVETVLSEISKQDFTLENPHRIRFL